MQQLGSGYAISRPGSGPHPGFIEKRVAKGRIGADWDPTSVDDCSSLLHQRQSLVGKKRQQRKDRCGTKVPCSPIAGLNSLNFELSSTTMLDVKKQEADDITARGMLIEKPIGNGSYAVKWLICV